MNPDLFSMVDYDPYRMGFNRMSACPFCDIVDYDVHTQVEWASHNSVMITPHDPVVSGHKLFIPLVHVRDAAEDPVVTGHVMLDAARYAQEALEACNIITSVGSAATQTVFHLHIHVVPRSHDDGLKLPWT